MEVKYVTMWCGWCSIVVGQPYGVGVWNTILRGCEDFPCFIRYEVGDEFKIRFCYDCLLGVVSNFPIIRIIIKKNGGMVYHFFLHYKVAKTIWNIFFFFCWGWALTWVMPRRLVDFLASWSGLQGNPQVTTIWNMTPLCMCWCI